MRVLGENNGVIASKNVLFAWDTVAKAIERLGMQRRNGGASLLQGKEVGRLVNSMVHDYRCRILTCTYDTMYWVMY